MSIESNSVDPRLMESEERYRAVIQNASDMIQSVRPDGTFEFVNQSWLDTLGYQAEDVPGLIIWDIIYPEAVEHCQIFFSKAVTGETIDYMQTTFMTKDGRPVPVEGNVTSRFLGETVVATHGFFRDISERLRAQELEALNVQLEGEKQARYLEKMAALGKLSAGLAHELNNPAAAAQRAISRFEESLIRRDADMVDLVKLQLSPEQWEVITSLVSVDHAAANGDLSLDPIAINDLETGIEEWLDDHDIARSWEIAPTLVQAGLTQEHLDRFATGVSVPALPAAIQWISETLTMRELTNVVTRSSHRISELVNAVKGYSYMDRAAELDVNIHEDLDNTLVILGHRLKSMTVQKNYDRALPLIHVHGNSLNQVWTNILDNAIDATDGNGTITIRTHQEDDNAVIELEDNGPGIAPEDLTCIFEPFFTTKSQGQGIGLGLDTVWRIVTEEHGGTIDVASEPGQTVFRIALPLSWHHHRDAE